MDLRRMGRRLLHEFNYAMALNCMTMGFPFDMVLYLRQERDDFISEGRADEAPPIQPPPDGHPERLVPYTALSPSEREFWSHLDHRT
ncbi:DUF6059 family protein [Actinomadura litoris]|uniref:DUF6059 family protein n=1 Tax=Actinomadura litoris TaxID=2678616 RepID=UPI001FA7CC88|nr:DUF6059 family protein [Actinomadura litoris]